MRARARLWCLWIRPSAGRLVLRLPARLLAWRPASEASRVLTADCELLRAMPPSTPSWGRGGAAVLGRESAGSHQLPLPIMNCRCV